MKTTAVSRECFACLSNRLLSLDGEDKCEGCEHNDGQRLRPLSIKQKMPNYRTCFSCHISKPIEEFPSNRSKPLGRGYMCRACRKDYERGRAPNRQPSEVTRELNRERSRRAYADNPEATRARAEVLRLINLGLIERLACQYPLCRKEKTDGHHPDYSKPLEVIWLCRGHHWLIERILKGSDEGPMPILFVHDYSNVESSRSELTVGVEDSAVAMS